jgi:lipoprotein signal peptidase
VAGGAGETAKHVVGYTLHMRWRPLVRDVAVSTSLALTVSGLFAYLDANPLLWSLGVLLFAGPVTDVVLELIHSRNPGAVEILAAPRWVRWAFIAWVAFIAVLSLAVSHWWHVGYWRTFAVAWLTIAAAGAVNAIVAEWEDNSPGGFLNPRQ